MHLIPEYDPADGKAINFVSEVKAQSLVDEGIAHAVRAKSGRIVRLYRRARERAYGSARDGIGGLHAAASLTTQRIRDDANVLVSPPWIREHRRTRHVDPPLEHR
jgi:hypothetical protein